MLDKPFLNPFNLSSVKRRKMTSNTTRFIPLHYRHFHFFNNNHMTTTNKSLFLHSDKITNFLRQNATRNEKAIKRFLQLRNVLTNQKQHRRKLYCLRYSHLQWGSKVIG